MEHHKRMTKKDSGNEKKKNDRTQEELEEAQ